MPNRGNLSIRSSYLSLVNIIKLKSRCSGKEILLPCYLTSIQNMWHTTWDLYFYKVRIPKTSMFSSFGLLSAPILDGSIIQSWFFHTRCLGDTTGNLPPPSKILCHIERLYSSHIFPLYLTYPSYYALDYDLLFHWRKSNGTIVWIALEASWCLGVFAIKKNLNTIYWHLLDNYCYL